MTVVPVPGAKVLTAADLTSDMMLDVLAGALSSIAKLSEIRAFFQTSGLPVVGFTTAALEAAAIPVADFVSGSVTTFLNTGTTPGNLPTPAAAAIVARLTALLGVAPAAGFTYLLMIRNGSGGANTATITAGADVTLSGTMTIAQNVTRVFVVTVTNPAGAGAVTVQSLGVSAAAA